MASTPQGSQTDPDVQYAVLATLPTLELRDQYREWLSHGHVQEVVACGARSAMVVMLDAGEGVGGVWRVLAVYRFPSQASLDRYLRHDAPRLRAQGQALFGPPTGVTFSRWSGPIIFETSSTPTTSTPPSTHA